MFSMATDVNYCAFGIILMYAGTVGGRLREMKPAAVTGIF